ncbi:MAG: HD domain-containing protein [Clostridia bacterium]|nr:HD domain-containing protein [Clostridia bacterium]NCC43808.1 HD domain-containing protein [Clostridia bacterium]
MDRITRIISHPLYQEQYKLLQDAEENRSFCNHTMGHFLDVARIMYIYNLEENAQLSKELIYAAALLHDIGRYEQIVYKTPHHIAGARIAGIILRDCDFSKEDMLRVQNAIAGHREAMEKQDRLSEYLYRADKLSRNCFLCKASSECNWSEEKKNSYISY